MSYEALGTYHHTEKYYAYYLEVSTKISIFALETLAKMLTHHATKK